MNEVGADPGASYWILISEHYVRSVELDISRLNPNQDLPLIFSELKVCEAAQPMLECIADFHIAHKLRPVLPQAQVNRPVVAPRLPLFFPCGHIARVEYRSQCQQPGGGKRLGHRNAVSHPVPVSCVTMSGVMSTSAHHGAFTGEPAVITSAYC
jgi:hypothetical protein